MEHNSTETHGTPDELAIVARDNTSRAIREIQLIREVGAAEQSVQAHLHWLRENMMRTNQLKGELVTLLTHHRRPQLAYHPHELNEAIRRLSVQTRARAG